MSPSLSRCCRRFGPVPAAFLFLLAGPLPAQDPAALRARLAEVEQRQQQVHEEIAFWDRMANDPDIIFVMAPFSPLPVPMHLSQAQQAAAEWMMTARFPAGRSGQEIAQSIAAWTQLTADIRRNIRLELIPRLNEDLGASWAEGEDLRRRLSAPSQPAQPLPPANQPMGEGWTLLETRLGWDTGPARDVTVLDAAADAAGGHVTMRYRVGGQCFETWNLSWTFGETLSFVRQGMRIPVHLVAELTEGDCNTANPSSVSLGTGPMERFVTGALQGMEGNALNRLAINVITGEGLQAAARSADPNTTGETDGVLVVNSNPALYPSYYVLRFYAYVPGQFWGAAYIFRAN